jgi:hypothetical protein
MFYIRSRNWQFGLVVAGSLSCALSCVMLPTASQAYTEDQQSACTGDAFRLCSSEIPDVDRVTVCMVRNKSQLSPGCRAFFRPGPEMTPVSNEAASVRSGRYKRPTAQVRRSKRLRKSAGAT